MGGPVVSDDVDDDWEKASNIDEPEEDDYS
jgi:hypothetical protein